MLLSRGLREYSLGVHCQRFMSNALETLGRAANVIARYFAAAVFGIYNEQLESGSAHGSRLAEQDLITMGESVDKLRNAVAAVEAALKTAEKDRKSHADAAEQLERKARNLLAELPESDPEVYKAVRLLQTRLTLVQTLDQTIGEQRMQLDGLLVDLENQELMLLKATADKEAADIERQGAEAISKANALKTAATEGTDLSKYVKGVRTRSASARALGGLLDQSVLKPMDQGGDTAALIERLKQSALPPSNDLPVNLLNPEGLNQRQREPEARQ